MALLYCKQNKKLLEHIKWMHSIPEIPCFNVCETYWRKKIASKYLISFTDKMKS